MADIVTSSSGLRLVTFYNGIVSSLDDALMWNLALNGRSGIISGCNVTASDNTLTISAGHGVVKGRKFVVDQTTIEVSNSTGSIVNARVILRMRLAYAQEPLQFVVQFADGGVMPDLVQDEDVNLNDSVYEIPLATFDMGLTAIDTTTLDTDVTPQADAASTIELTGYVRGTGSLTPNENGVISINTTRQANNPAGHIIDYANWISRAYSAWRSAKGTALNTATSNRDSALNKRNACRVIRDGVVTYIVIDGKTYTQWDALYQSYSSTVNSITSEMSTMATNMKGAEFKIHALKKDTILEYVYIFKAPKKIILDALALSDAPSFPADFRPHGYGSYGRYTFGTYYLYCNVATDGKASFACNAPDTTKIATSYSTFALSRT